MKIKELLKSRIQKRKKILIGIGVFTLFFSWASGFLTGWWWAKGRIGKFPDLDSETRLLVLVPHPDDEVLISGGLIQETKAKSGEVKVVYLTVGDSSIGSVIRTDKNLKFSPEDFIALGEKRRGEAIEVAKILGLRENELVFLAFPDQGLREVVARTRDDSRGPVVSRSTKLDHVPYPWAYKPGQSYVNEELMDDLKDILNEFKPTLLVTTHPRDNHPDHKAASEIVEVLRGELGKDWDLYYGLVHFKGYPPSGEYLVPPKKLFNEAWKNFVLDNDQLAKKREAILKYSSQTDRIDKSWYLKFMKKNETWENGS